MVGVNGVHHRFTFFIPLGNLHTDLDVRAFHLMVEGLADVMQQACAFGQGRIEPQLGGHNAGEIGHLQRMLEHVLTVAGTVTQAAQELD